MVDYYYHAIHSSSRVVAEELSTPSSKIFSRSESVPDDVLGQLVELETPAPSKLVMVFQALKSFGMQFYLSFPSLICILFLGAKSQGPQHQKKTKDVSNSPPGTPSDDFANDFRLLSPFPSIDGEHTKGEYFFSSRVL